MLMDGETCRTTARGLLRVRVEQVEHVDESGDAAAAGEADAFRDAHIRDRDVVRPARAAAGMTCNTRSADSDTTRAGRSLSSLQAPSTNLHG